MINYEWIYTRDREDLDYEEKRVCEKYVPARKTNDYILRVKWFDYWLDYLQIRNMNNKD